MSIQPGNKKIQTSSGMYLTLLTDTGILTARPDNGGAANQIWNFKTFGNNWVVTNTGYESAPYASSSGGSGASVSGGTSSTQWTIAATGKGDTKTFQMGNDSSSAWAINGDDQVELSRAQPNNAAQQFTIRSA